MNETDFALLVERYLDDALQPDERRALREAVLSSPDLQRQFEEQIRQHVRLHAQTSRCDLTESQRIAVMVMDIAEKGPETRHFDMFREQTVREKVAAILAGLRAPRDSGAHRYACYALLRIFAPSTISVAVSVAVVLLLFTVTIRLPPPEQTPLPPITTVPIEIVPEPLPLLPVVPEDKRLTSEDRFLPDRLSVNDLFPPDTAALPPETPPRPDDRKPDFTADLAHLPVSPTFSRLVLPYPYVGRTGPAREKIIGKDKHIRMADDAVVRALRWLKERQQPDGSWEGQERAAMTGLALLAFLGRGETQDSEEFGATVGKAIRYLLNVQDVRGAFSTDAYAQGIATYALSEACTMTGIMSVREAMEKAVQVLIDGQQSRGGFNYGYSKGDRFDTSVSGWQIQAFKAAKIARCANPALDAAIERSLGFLKNDAFALDGSGFVYCGTPGIAPPTGARWTMTGVGTLCLQLFGEGASTPARAGLKALEPLSFSWPAGAVGKAPVYGGYYVTQAKYQEGKKMWDTWDKRFSRELVEHQQRDGHWEGGDYEQGSYVYTTCLCTLMLEVYYRHLPTYQIETLVSAGTNAPGDVRVEVR